MGISLAIVDHDALFATLSEPPIIVNDFNVASADVKEKLNNLIYTRYDGDTLEVLPSCQCGKICGEFNVGVKCPDCKSVVSAITERPLESTLWIATPKGVRSLVNPAVWNILSKNMTISGCDILEWLTNPGYTPRGQIPPAVLKLQRMGIQRGLNYFIDNFDAVMNAAVSSGAIKVKGRERDELIAFINKYRAILFPRYLPVPSRLNFITESTATGTYTDTSMTTIVDAILTITSIEAAVIPVNQRQREARTAKALAQIAEYYNSFYTMSLGKKVGWLRKHVFGSRLHFSFRAVISSLSENHQYDEIHMPWSMSVLVFKAHLTSKLLARGFTPNQCNQFIFDNSLRYNELMDTLFQELIAESPYGGIPIVLQRNPTLVRLSAQALRVTKVKTEVEINTVSMSTLVLKGPNADFDGDALNGMIILDHGMYEKIQRLAPHLGVLDLQKPRTISNILALPAQVLATISNWMYEKQA